MTENEQFARGVAHFNAREFFEAHEVWEELWLRAPEPEKTFLQGMIQIAAAFHHYQRGNLSGARSLLSAGLAKIEGRTPSRRGIDISGLRDQSKACFDALLQTGKLGTGELPLIRASAP